MVFQLALNPSNFLDLTGISTPSWAITIFLQTTFKIQSWIWWYIFSYNLDIKIIWHLLFSILTRETHLLHTPKWNTAIFPFPYASSQKFCTFLNDQLWIPTYFTCFTLVLRNNSFVISFICCPLMTTPIFLLEMMAWMKF